MLLRRNVPQFEHLVRANFNAGPFRLALRQVDERLEGFGWVLAVLPEVVHEEEPVLVGKALPVRTNEKEVYFNSLH